MLFTIEHHRSFEISTDLKATTTAKEDTHFSYTHAHIYIVKYIHLRLDIFFMYIVYGYPRNKRSWLKTNTTKFVLK